MIDRSEMRDTPLTPLVVVAAMMSGTRVAETILASSHVRPHTKAGHMIASDSIKSLLNNLARRVPSTYGVRIARRLNLFHDLAVLWPAGS